jgi:ferredoxin
MRQIMVDTNLCKRDGACAAVCPARVLSLNEERLPEAAPGGSYTAGLCSESANTRIGLYLPENRFVCNGFSTSVPFLPVRQKAI